ncbi:MAG: hypothetical protein SFX19_08230 [Alphaproteobacteria bacterium]|nr:hypothetical protein [Alphaproteobacteria bacterium]
MDNNSKLDPEIAAARKNLAELVHYAMTNCALAADLRAIADKYPTYKEYQDAVGEVLEVLTNISQFQHHALLEKRGGFSFEAMSARDPTPYGFPIDDLKKLIEFGQNLRPPIDTRARTSYTANVLEPARNLLHTITMPPGLRKLLAFYTTHKDAIHEIGKQELSDNIRRDIRYVQDTLSYLGAVRFEDQDILQAVKKYESIIKNEDNSHYFKALLAFSESLRHIDASTPEIAAACAAYQEIASDVNAYIYALVPMLAPKVK